MTKIFSLFFDPNYVKTTSNHQTTRFGGFSEEFLKKFVRPNLAIHGSQKKHPGTVGFTFSVESSSWLYLGR